MNRYVFCFLAFLGQGVFGAEYLSERNAIAITTQFAFYSDFSTNLNDALIVAGAEKLKDAGNSALEEESAADLCFAQLPTAVQAGWKFAVEYYAKVVTPVGWQGREQFLLRLDLAELSDTPQPGIAQYTQLVKNVRAAAAPAYRACWWTQQDKLNREWIQRLHLRLIEHEQAIASRLEMLYQQPWHGLPLAVDIVANAPPVGANSIYTSPVGGHILVASNVAQEDALEIVFHEASHTIVSSRRQDAIPVALANAARELGVELPQDLWHVILFYITGEVVKERLLQTEKQNYITYLYKHNLWNGRWSRYQQAVESSLPDYLVGKISMEVAVQNILRALGS